MNLNRNEVFKTKMNEYTLRMFPNIIFLDIGQYEVENQKISIANLQIETPDSFLTETNPPQLTPEAEDKQKKKIEHFLKEAVERDTNLIVLPELSTSEVICNEMQEKFAQSPSIIILGSYYDDHSRNLSPILINGQVYGQLKNHPSYMEKEYMQESRNIGVFINTPIGDFSVLICYDATDFSILSALQDYTDFIVCIARTKDIVTFRNIFKALTYLQYQYVIFCNDAQYGGSSFFLPLHGNRALDTLGQKNEGIIYRTFDLKKLDEMRAFPKKNELFKYPPASSKPRHIPHVKKDYRKKEYFESRSFNYLSQILRYEILNDFLARINVSRSFSGIRKGMSVYRLDDILLRSCKAMYSPGIPVEAMELKPIIWKYFLVDLLESLFQNDKTILEQKNREEISKRLSKITGKQYILFEIDHDIIGSALPKIPELIDELLRIYDIEKEKKLREIPDELQIES